MVSVQKHATILGVTSESPKWLSLAGATSSVLVALCGSKLDVATSKCITGELFFGISDFIVMGSFLGCAEGDDGRLLALHARRFYTDVESRHANTSGERESLVPYLAAGKDVKSDCVQSGMDHFVDRSRELRLRVGW